MSPKNHQEVIELLGRVIAMSVNTVAILDEMRPPTEKVDETSQRSPPEAPGKVENQTKAECRAEEPARPVPSNPMVE